MSGGRRQGSRPGAGDGGEDAEYQTKEQVLENEGAPTGHPGQSRKRSQQDWFSTGIHPLKIGFEYSQEAQSLVQLRQPLVPPRGEARSDLQLVFDLATRLGLGAHFWDGDIEAAFRYQLEPSGITLEELRAHPAGVRVPLTTRYRKYAATGFAIPSRKVELYSPTLAAHSYSPLPTFEEPLTSPRSRPDLADRYPLAGTAYWGCQAPTGTEWSTRYRNCTSGAEH